MEEVVVLALGDDSLMFLQASRENLKKEILVQWNQFASASGLHSKWSKSSLIL